MTQRTITTCQDLLTCLEQAVQGDPGSQTLPLSGDLFPAAAVLAGYLGLTSLTVDQLDAATPLVQSGAPKSCALITGKAVLFPNGTRALDYRVEIQADVQSGAVTLLLEAKPLDVTTWTFGDNFTDLPEYTGVQDSVLKRKPSFFISMVVADPVFRIATIDSKDQKAGLSFSGLVDMTKGDLAPAGKYLPNSSKIPLSGAIEMRDGTFPLIAFKGDLGAYSIPPVANLSLEFATEDAGDVETAPASSTLLLIGTSKLKEGIPEIHMSAPILEGEFVWAITARIADEKYSLTDMLSAMVAYAGGSNLPLPSGMSTDSFRLDSVTVAVKPASPPSVQMIGFRVIVGEQKIWTAPLFGLNLTILSTEWQVLLADSKPQLAGAVDSLLRFGSDPDSPQLYVNISLDGITTASAPDVSIAASVDPDLPVKLNLLFQQLTGISIDLDLKITELLFEAQTGPRTLQFSSTLEGDWPLTVPLIEFPKKTKFLFNYTPNSITGSVFTDITIASFNFLVSAEYAGTGEGWEFTGSLAPESQGKPFQDFVNAVTGNAFPKLPGNLGAIELQRLELSFNTGTKEFSFEGLVAWPFKFDKFDLTIEAELSLKSPGPEADEKRQYGGYARGSLAINNFQFSVLYRFDIEDNTSLTFLLEFQGVTLTCTYTREGTDRIITANLGGVTFGGILDYLISLATPGEGFTLPAPWDVLYDIRFDDLTLRANLDKKEVGISYKVGANLGIASIKTIGLTYKNRAGRGTVIMTMTGSFVDQEYDEKKPLTWDMVNDPPPTPPGKGDQLLDLRFAGIGQNVGFRTAGNFTNVQSVIQAMQAAFKEVDDEENPLASKDLAALQFTGDGRWLIGADFTLMDAVTLNIVFNDPVLYGLRVALAGDKVKSFAGLDFQILYKKVTDTIGVYYIELTLPDAYRQLNFGAVAVTLPIVVVEIYTNGNFRVDLGFPRGLDFSRSFCVQAGPFIGYGGLYFALLDSSTSERVPRITNGTFSPVIEAGLALSVGMGRTIDKGIFKAGATITVVGILQGVFGWFNPNDNNAPSAQYYWIQGTIALAGKVSGSVDFVVIQAEVSLSLTASVVLTFESYKASLVVVTFQVTASASIKILFFRVSFSFSTSFELSFTIGSGSQTPWILDTSTPTPHLLRQQGSRHPARLTAAALQRAIAAAANSGSFDWQPRAVFNEPQTIPLSLMPALTVALPAQVQATHASNAGTPDVETVFALFIPTSVPSSAVSAKDILRVENPAAAEANPFNRIAAGMLLWSLSSYTRSALLAAAPPTTETQITDLEAIGEFLADSDNWEAAFSYANLAGLMNLNYRLAISTPMGPFGISHPHAGPLANADAAPDISSTVFPMVPELNVDFASLPNRNFGNYHCITPEYEQSLGNYYRQLRNGDTEIRELPPQPPTAAQADGECPAGSESLATFLFRDYFAVIAKGAVQAASDLFHAYPYEATGIGMSGPTAQHESLASIAQQFSGPPVVYRTQRGDTPTRIAARFGVHPEEIHAANPHLLAAAAADALPPGTEVTVAASVTPQSIAAANSTYPLNFNFSYPVYLTVQGVKHQVRIGTDNKSEAISQIVWNYGLVDAAALFPLHDPSNTNFRNPAILQPGVSIGIPARTVAMFTAPHQKENVAAFFFVRNLGDPSSADQPWYADLSWYQSWIVANNPEGLPGPAVTVPTVVQEANGALRQTGTTTWEVQGTDSLRRDTAALIAGYCAVLQIKLAPWGEKFAAFAATVDDRGNGTYAIPPIAHTVRPGDTIESIAKTFGIEIADLVNYNAHTPGLLQLLSVLALPTLNCPVAQGDTLASLADAFDLSLDDLARSVQNDPGILTPFYTSGARLTIPDVPARSTELLLADLVRFGSFNNVAGMAANFLLHGMRVPLPNAPIVNKTFPPDTQLWALYEMAGQQFPVTFGSEGPTGINAVLHKSPVDWVRFDAPSPSGPTGLADLPVYLNADYLADHPGLTLQPQILAGPASLPLYREVPPQYSFQQTTHWQSSSVRTFPGPTGIAPGPSGHIQQPAGQPSLWIFPPALQQVTAGATGPLNPSPAYELVAQRTDAPLAAAPVRQFYWGMAVDIRIQQARSADGGVMPNAFIVQGADQEGRQLLLKAWTALQLTTPPYGSIDLLYAPGAASANAQGLASSTVDPNQTFILKSNLTTVTRSNLLAASALPENNEYSAPISAAPNFLRLLWEASVTGSGGFYLNYVAAGGAGLPQTLFAAGETATLTLVFVSAMQSDLASPQRGLFPFNNCAVVGDNIDTSSTALCAQLAAPAPFDLQRIATTPAGTIGYYLARLNPDTGASGPLPPDDQTRSLYSLISAQLQDTDGFAGSNWSLPLGPGDDPVPGVSGPTGPGIWWYQQLLPVAQFGKQNQAPQSAALPAAAENPYAGIAGPTGLTGPASLSSADLAFAFRDVYGNQTAVGITMPALSIPVGYTDELIGLSTWPGVGLDYAFLPGPSGASVTLQAEISLQSSRYTAAGTYTFTQANEAALADAQRYRQIFYQVQQADLNFVLDTNLGHVALAPASLKPALASLASRATVFCNTTAALQQHYYKTGGAETLSTIVTDYWITPEELIAANPNLLVSDLFSSAVRVVLPSYLAAPPMNTLLSLVQGQEDQPYPPVCTGHSGSRQNAADAFVSSLVGGLRMGGTAPSLQSAPVMNAGQSLTVERLAANNKSLPLTPGNILLIQANNTTQPLASELSLSSIAAQIHCAVYAEFTQADGASVNVGLYAENLDTANIVTPNLKITIGDVTVDTGAAPTLRTVTDGFAALQLTPGELVQYLEQIAGLILPSATLRYATLVVPTPVSGSGPATPPAFSLADLPASAGDIASLAKNNAAVANFYYAGSPVYLSYRCYTPSKFDTFTSLAHQERISLGQLVSFNSNVRVQPGVRLMLPSLFTVPDSVPVYASLNPAANDSLSTLAAIADQNDARAGLEQISTLNRYIPGLYADGVAITLTVAGAQKTVTPSPSDSLDAIALQFGLPYGDFIAASAPIASLYRTTASFVIPLPNVPKNVATGWSLSWNEIAGRFHLQPSGATSAAAAILTANRCLLFFLQLNAFIAGPPNSEPIQVSTFDTVDTIIRRFAWKQGITLTVDDLVRYNGDTTGLTNWRSPFLLPPNPAVIVSLVAPQIPPSAESAESQIIFPVTVSLRMTRNPLLVAPQFQSSPAVFENTSVLSPRGWSGSTTSLQLTSFALQFEQAFAGYQLKCAVSRRGSGVGAAASSLWAVNFGPNGIRTFAVEAASPNFYAIEPLSTDLISGDVEVYPYESGCGLCPPVTRRFDSVDLDSWMQQFLSTVDLFLTTPYAVPAFQFGTLSASPAAPHSAATVRASSGPRSFAEIVHLGVGASPAAAMPSPRGPSGCGECTGGTGSYGPSNFESIVASKLTIAKQLSHSVLPILDGVGPTGNYYSAQARDAIYQQMLVELSSAYNVNAVVQYPVDVQSPCVLPTHPSGPSAQIPPRLSGNVVPALPIVAPDGPRSLRGIAEAARISVPWCAEVLSAAQGILKQGAMAEYNGKSRQISFDDSIQSLAAALVDDKLNPNDWPRWTQFAAGIAAQPLMVAAVPLPIVRVSRLVPGGALLEDLARFFGVDAASVGKSNQDLPDVLIPGSRITIAGHAPYDVKPGDSLATIAASLQPPMSVPTLANAIGRTANLLNPGKMLFMVDRLPDVALSTAKVSLGRVDSLDGVAPALSFLFSIKHPRQFKNLFLNLKYVINEAEYQIASVNDPGGYQDSSWLTFLLPFGSGLGSDFGVETAIPQVQIPIPLRSYPVPPSLVAQSGIPSEHPAPPKNPDEAIVFGREWDYRFDFQGTNAAQDTDHVEVTFNAGRSDRRFAAPSRKRLIFEALARFMEVFAPLSADLAILPTLHPGESSEKAAAAVQVLDSLTAGVAAALRTLPTAFAQDAWPELRYLYRLQTQSTDAQWKDLELSLERGPTGTSAWPLWPDILVHSPTGATGEIGPDEGFVRLDRVNTGDLTATYKFPPDFSVNDPLRQRFLFPRRDAIQNRNAWSGVYLTRNDDLIGAGPLGWTPGGVTGPMAPVNTNNAFLYQTPLVRFVDPTAPLLVDGSEIDVAGLTGAPGPSRILAAHIETMLDAVLEWAASSPTQAIAPLSILCSYGYPLSGAGMPGEVIAITPVLLMPTEFLQPGEKSSFAEKFSKAIENWPGWPTRDPRGALIFDVSLYTVPFDAVGATAELKPLLQYQNLRVPVDKIENQ